MVMLSYQFVSGISWTEINAGGLSSSGLTAAVLQGGFIATQRYAWDFSVYGSLIGSAVQ